MVKGKVCQKLTQLFGRLSAMVNSLFFPLLSHKPLSDWADCTRIRAAAIDCLSPPPHTPVFLLARHHLYGYEKTVPRDQQISIPPPPTLPNARMGEGTREHKKIDAKRMSHADA